MDVVVINTNTMHYIAFFYTNRSLFYGDARKKKQLKIQSVPEW